MNKKNVKGFVKEHKKEIKFVAATVLIGTVGFMLGRRQRAGTYIDNGVVEKFVLDEDLENFLLDAEEQYQGKCVTFVSKSGEPIKPESLGELGKAILKNGGAENETFKYFLAIGGPYDET